MERSKNDIWVGLFVIVGMAAVVFLALQAANLLALTGISNGTYFGFKMQEQQVATPTEPVPAT